MIQAGNFKEGTTFEVDGDVWQIVGFQHIKPGKGATFVRTKIRSVITSSNRDMTFSPSEKYEGVRIETGEMQYLYDDGTLYYFIGPNSYEQLPINKASVEEAIFYIKESDTATVKFFRGKAFQVSPPNFIELEITQTRPRIKGNTATGTTKPATVGTGATVNVPLFVDEGDRTKINIRTGEYLSRV